MRVKQVITAFSKGYSQVLLQNNVVSGLFFFLATGIASFNMGHPGWICPYISRHLLSLNPLLACCRRYSRGER
ncbi:TPA: urea transporter [Escherichia coli]|uniref:urea transporter n=1 Tax=Escherichia coli TaxID=562 RepID=UPI00201CCC4F|nr:urea transporter [Escherichia coli]